MTLIIELRDEDLTALSAKARAHGVSAEQYAEQVPKRDLERQNRLPVSAKIRELWSDMPADVRAKLPEDGANQVDHYVYGLPKRDQR